MKRKLIVVFMTIVMAVSLAFGMSIMTVGAADELTLGAVTLASDGNIEFECSQFTGGDNVELITPNQTTGATTQIYVTSGENKYYASHVRQIVNARKRFSLFFIVNGKSYNFGSATKGDLLTIEKGLTFASYPDLTVSEDINYIFTGSSWIKGKELPTEAEALVLGDVSLTNGSQIEIANTQFTAADEKELAINGKEYIVLTGADGETYTPSNVRQMGKVRKAFKLYFNNANANGKKYSFASSAKGDLLTVKKGLTITGNEDGAEYNIEVKADINYIYTGSAWISGTELPSEVEIAFPATISATAWNSNTEIRIPTGFAIKNSADLKPTADTLALVKVVSGDTTYNATNIYEWNGCLSFYFNNTGYTGKTAKRGDILSVGAGFTVNHNGTTYVCADGIKYIFNGLFWVKGDTLAQQTELELPDTLDVSYWSNNTELRIPSNIENKDVANLNPAADALALVKIVGANKEYKAAYIYGWAGSDGKGRLTFYFNNTGYTGKTPAKGDKLVIGKNFIITSGGKEFVCTNGKTYVFNGSLWVDEEDYIDYDKLTKNGIDTKEKELTLYKGDEFVLPELFYTYTTEVKVPETVDADDVTIENAPDMNTVNENGYQVTLKVGDFSVNITVKVLDTTELNVTNVGVDLNWNKIAVETDTANQKSDINAHTEYLRYFEYDRDGVKLTVSGYIIYGNKYGIDVKDTDGNWMVRNGVSYCKVGDKLTIKKGLPFLAGERLVETIAYVYNGNVWVNAEDYIDYDKLTKNGIDTKEKELTLYKGDEFVLPELFYTYTTEVKVPETVDADDVTIENAPDMNTVNENGYQVTLKVGDFSVNITVKVLDTTELNVTNVGVDLNWNKIAVETDTANQKSDINAHTEYLRYFEYDRDGVKLTVSGYIIYGNKYEIDVKDTDGNWMVRDKVAYCKVGDKFTVKKGLPFINGERLTETVTYVYNGTKFVKLVEPETFDVDATMSVFVNGVKQINVKDDATVTAVYKYASSDDTVATVSETGVVKGIKVGTAKITVSYKDVSKEITVTVSEEPAKKGIEIVSDIEIFYVPVATATADNNFTSMGYTLLARYLYVDGSVGDVFDVEASQIGDINYTVAGLKDLTITIGEFTATVKVNVYEYKNVTSFTSLGVSGYDVNDDRNQPGTWNGHMIIGMNSISTSKGNMLSTESSEKMSEYIVYETAEGNKYYGKADENNDIIDRIGVWQLGTNLLIMIKPEGSNANVGYGSEDHWKSDASYGYVPVYKAGDKITFLAGMPIYAWKGSLGENNYPAEGKGCLIVEGYVTEDIVYYCYEEDGVKSLWQIYKEYTDFTVNPSVTLTVGGTGSIGAVKTPIDATTGKFTYESSDPAVVTVTKDGNLAGLGIGTATVTVTLTGGKDADGNALDPIVKTVTVTVKKGIKSVSGEITVTKGATIDLADYEITVRYTDGTEENISLGANNVIVEDIDTSVTGTTEYGVRVTIDGETKRGTLTVTVKDAKKGCKGDVVSVSSILGLAFVTAGVIIVRKKGKKA